MLNLETNLCKSTTATTYRTDVWGPEYSFEVPWGCRGCDCAPHHKWGSEHVGSDETNKTNITIFWAILEFFVYLQIILCLHWAWFQYVMGYYCQKVQNSITQTWLFWEDG